MEVVRNMFCFDGSHRQSDIDFEKQFQLDPCEFSAECSAVMEASYLSMESIMLMLII